MTRGLASLLVGLVAGSALALAAPAAAQVYKCTDPAGRITYQQTPCGPGATGGRVSVVPATGNAGAERADEEWEARAKRKEVVPGMPRAFVVQAYGAPEEMRPGRAWKNATEVWRYKRRDLTTALGFTRGVVAWKNDNLSDAPPPAEPVPSRRQDLAVGLPCQDLMDRLGAPAATTEGLDDGIGRVVRVYTWEPDAGDRERTLVSCYDGRIVRIERMPM